MIAVIEEERRHIVSKYGAPRLGTTEAHYEMIEAPQTDDARKKYCDIMVKFFANRQRRTSCLQGLRLACAFIKRGGSAPHISI